jgi:hypothetical protein
MGFVMASGHAAKQPGKPTLQRLEPKMDNCRSHVGRR